ncbi:MAG: tRNA pseudouridine(38-40) synthase TruA [Bacillota bacterium]
MTLNTYILKSSTIQELFNYIDENALLKYPNHEIIEGKSSVQQFLQEIYKDKPLIVKAYLSYFIATTEDNHMIKIKTDEKTISTIYIEINPPHTRYLFNIAYDGTHYQGFQRQPNKKTVQGAIESVLHHLMKNHITIHPASRTDAHVHAHDQYFHADLNLLFSTEKLHTLMNRMLDQDIVIKSIEAVPYVFHARYDVIEKTYTYHLHHTKDPFKSKYSTYHENIKINRLVDVMQPLVGTHDFKHFSKKHTKENSIRTIKQINVYGNADDTIIEITGTGFLRHMVRMIVGQALHDHDYNTSTLFKAISHRKTHIQSFSVPASGLHLDKINYKKSSH